MMEEYLERPGFQNEPGWVKGNPRNNSSYVEKCKEYYPASWVELIESANKRLTELDPGYNIDQIKVKFGGLRFYCSFSENLDADTLAQARQILFETEAAAPELN